MRIHAFSVGQRSRPVQRSAQRSRSRLAAMSNRGTDRRLHSGDEDRDRRPRLRRPAACRRLRRGGARGGRARHRPAQDRGAERGPQLHRGRPRRRPRAAGATACGATADHADLELLRRDRDLRADPADQLARARPHLPARRGDGALQGPAARASSWCWSRPPTPARPASACCRSSRSRASRPARDFHLAFSPERIDPGRTDYTIRTTPKLVGGLTEACAERARELYALICDEVVVLSTPEAAELSKLLENIFRSVNIALVNELAQLCDRLGIDVWEVIDAAATKPFGFMRFDPGPGMGGHCLPVDPFYLAFKAARARLLPRVHRAGRQGQPGPAGLLRRTHRARPQRRRQAGQAARRS